MPSDCHQAVEQIQGIAPHHQPSLPRLRHSQLGYGKDARYAHRDLGLNGARGGAN